MKIEDNFGILLAGVGDLFGFISNWFMKVFASERRCELAKYVYVSLGWVLVSRILHKFCEELPC